MKRKSRFDFYFLSPLLITHDPLRIRPFFFDSAQDWMGLFDYLADCRWEYCLVVFRGIFKKFEFFNTILERYLALSSTNLGVFRE